VTEIRSFLGLGGYYRRFVQGFSSIIAPLIKLTWKNVLFVWTEQCNISFQELKRRLTIAPILTLPLGSSGFLVCRDVSNVGLSCVLMQDGKVIAYGSRQLKDHGGTMQLMTWNYQQLYLLCRCGDITFMERNSRSCNSLSLIF
jgi:hypothetical protein